MSDIGGYCPYCGSGNHGIYTCPDRPNSPKESAADHAQAVLLAVRSAAGLSAGDGISLVKHVKEVTEKIKQLEIDRDHWKGKFLIRDGMKYRDLQLENRELKMELHRRCPPSNGREFVICGITHRAFEIIKGKMFVEFRGEPPKLPIYVSETKAPPVARNPSDTWKE